MGEVEEGGIVGGRDVGQGGPEEDGLTFAE